VAGRILVIPGSTSVRPDDRGLLYGDGVFETIHLRPGGPWLLDAHLDRMAASARLLELPLPPRDALAALAGEAMSAWRAETYPAPSGEPIQPRKPGGLAGPPAEEASSAHPAEGALRLICTRGPVGGPPTVYATVSAVPDATLRERRDGVRLITGDLGVSARRPAWSISGAKSISYAQNLAARRWAVAQGADEVLWFSTEGFALETPTASLVWLAGDTLYTVPAADTGVLAGTTAAHLLSRAAELGLRSAEATITRESLASADGIWLASSLRGLAEAVTLDGRQRARSDWTERMLELLGF
jgi:4-amino-4-deoxychorismate lyase